MQAFRCVALVPHRDCRRLLRDYRRSLFAEGFAGAYSFPEAAPLAVTERPWSREELKGLAHSLRSLTGERAFHTGGGKFLACPGGPPFWGLSLNLPPWNAGLGLVSDPALCAALIDDPGNHPLDKIPPPPGLFFRAASLANLVWEPLGAYSSVWRIGQPCWLPLF